MRYLLHDQGAGFSQDDPGMELKQE
jgi:hypothetical protein